MRRFSAICLILLCVSLAVGCSVGVPDATNTPGPTDTPTMPLYEYLAHATYQDTGGNTVVVGVARYHGKLPVISPEASVTLKDANGTVIATQQALDIPDRVEPEGLVPFRVQFSSAPGGINNYVSLIKGGSTSAAIQNSFTPQFEITQSNIQKGGMYKQGRISGAVRYHGTHLATYPQIYAIIWSNDNNLLDVSVGWMDISKMSPGQETPFEIDIENGQGASRAEIVVSAVSGR